MQEWDDTSHHDSKYAQQNSKLDLNETFAFAKTPLLLENHIMFRGKKGGSGSIELKKPHFVLSIISMDKTWLSVTLTSSSWESLQMKTQHFLVYIYTGIWVGFFELQLWVWYQQVHNRTWCKCSYQPATFYQSKGQDE